MLLRGDDDILNSSVIPIPRGASVCRLVVRNAAYSSDNFMSRQLFCKKFSYEIGSHCMGRYD